MLVIDTAERLRLLDGWLRLEFLPSLPAHARVVIATRDAPGAVWRASFGELLQTIALGPLSPADAAEVLRAAGLDEHQAEWVNRFVRGHPLSLQLAASAVRERPGRARGRGPADRRAGARRALPRRARSRARARCSTPRRCCAG